MVYTKHTWVEYTGTGANKATWMNNMETQYDEVVSYYTTTLHDTSYYTETECYSMPMYNPLTQGTGSGFVAATLDSYSAADIIASAVAAGTIVIWNDSVANIPTGWHLCDGRAGATWTPNLRDSFPIAAGVSYVLGATGGAATVTSTASAVTVATHVLTQYEMPSHTHGGITDYLDNINGGAKGYTGYPNTDVNTSVWTTAAGSDVAHGHSGSTLGAGVSLTGNNLPAYKAYCYIIKE
jgi:microcystin-dependent protein